MADEQIRHYHDGSFYSLYLDYCRSKEDSKPLSFTAFMRTKPFWVHSSHKVISCICIYHRKMMIRCRALAKVRSTLHKAAPGLGVNNGNCKHESSCACRCEVCSAGNTASELGNFKDTVMCPRVGTQRHYNVACVLGKCESCGFERKVSCCPVEKGRKNLRVKAKVLDTVIVDTPKGPKSVAAEVWKEALYGKFISDTAKDTKAYPKL